MHKRLPVWFTKSLPTSALDLRYRGDTQPTYGFDVVAPSDSHVQVFTSLANMALEFEHGDGRTRFVYNKVLNVSKTAFTYGCWCAFRSADRQALGKITKDGVFLEQLETDVGQYLPEV